VRKAGTQVRITNQLIDASTGAHLWADCFEGRLADIFDLQDQVALGVVSAVTPKMRGMASFYQRSREAIDDPLRLVYARYRTRCRIRPRLRH
jgi:hypothetical protein